MWCIYTHNNYVGFKMDPELLPFLYLLSFDCINLTHLSRPKDIKANVHFKVLIADKRKEYDAQ